MKYNELIQIDEYKHLTYVMENKIKNGWAEEHSEKVNSPSPLVTAQMILGLLPFLNNVNNKMSRNIDNLIKKALLFLFKSFKKSGWSDHSGGHLIIDATGAVLTAILTSIQTTNNYFNNIENKKIIDSINFIKEQQNPDGGWSIRKGGTSKIQFTYWALRALCIFDIINKNNFFCSIDIHANIQKGIKWLKKNYEQNSFKGFSITLNGDYNIIATTYGVELFIQNDIPLKKEIIYNMIKDTQISRGRWKIYPDTTTVGEIPRRVYVFNDIPRIIECLCNLDVDLNDDLLQNVLINLKELELENGGFALDKIHANGWLMAEALKLISILKIKYQQNIEKYNNLVFTIKKHSFAKAVLMIGRYRPPHIGHYNGLKAIIYCNEDEFLFPQEVIKEISDIDKIIIGIARYDYNKANPFTIGAVREIWRKIIDKDDYLKEKSSMIEIITCPAEKNTTNVLTAIDELTYKRDSIIIISGNDRVIEQCNLNNIRYFQFKRSNKELSGTEIRKLIADIDFQNLNKKSELVNKLKSMLHPIAFDIMKEDGLFQNARKIINAI